MAVYGVGNNHGMNSDERGRGAKSLPVRDFLVRGKVVPTERECKHGHKLEICLIN